MKALFIIFIGYVGYIGAGVLKNDQQAYDYCLHESQSFIAIVWPIAEGKDSLIKMIFSRYGEVLYHKKYYFDKPHAFTVLQQAHQHIPSNQPHCGSMKEHLKWYFPKSAYQKPARIFVLHFESAAQAVACKYAIRKLYPDLQYRSVHINDYHHETIELAKFFFH